MATDTGAVTGALSRAAIKAGESATDVAWDAGTVQAFPFMSESIIEQKQVLHADALMGRRSRGKENSFAGTSAIGGSIETYASPHILSNWIKAIVGDNATAVSGAIRYDIADALDPFALLIDKRGAIFEYSGCQVNSATLSSAVDQVISLSFDVVGLQQNTESSWDSNITAINTTLSNNPLVFSSLGLFLSSEGSVPAQSFTLSIDNALETYFTHGVLPTSIVPTDRIITLSVTVPYNATNHSSLYGGSDGAGILTLTNSSVEVQFNFAHLALTKKTPVVSGRQTIGLDLEYQALSSAFVAGTHTTHEMYVTIDSTP